MSFHYLIFPLPCTGVKKEPNPTVMLSVSEALGTHLSNPKTGCIPPIVILSVSEESVAHQMLPKVSRKAPATPVILSAAKNWSPSLHFQMYIAWIMSCRLKKTSQKNSCFAEGLDIH